MATIAQILMAQGQEQAESRRRRAGAWMPLVQHLATLPNQVMADRAAEGMAREAGFDRAQQRAVRGQQLAKGAQDLETGKREMAASEATAEQKRQMNDVLQSPGVLDPTNQRMDARKAQEVAAAKGYTEILDDILTLAPEHNAAIDKGMREQTLFDQGQTDRRQATNQQGVRRMIGESIAGRGGEPISLADRQTYQGMALQEGVTLPAGVLPEPEKPDTRSLQQQANDALRKGDTQRYSQIMRVIRESAAAGRDPNANTGPQPTYSWAKDPKTGDIVRATDAEIRARGLQQPDTADMRNKEAGKRTAARAVDAVRDLGSRIITKVGPAQRVDAIKRGAEAVFGNDPEFRTYQDSRMALAGTLAVEQQGSRVSDADVKALWLPMVPDAYRDTAESYKLKWDLINAMRGVEGKAGGTPNATDQPPQGGADPLGIR